MCGIAGAVGHEDVHEFLIQGLQRLKYRGYDSAGIVVQSAAGGLTRVRRQGPVEELVEALDTASLSGRTGLAHTRWATHGQPNERNAQPHFSDQSFGLVHNGIIENYAELKAELIADGYEFTSDTDSEVIVHLVAKHYSELGDLVASVHEVTKKLFGTYAICVLSQREPGRLVAARAGCPIVAGSGEQGHYVASDVATLTGVVSSYLVLHENDIVQITEQGISVFADGHTRVDREFQQLEEQVVEVRKDPYPFFMAKEIAEQPEVVRNTLEGRIGEDHVYAEALGVGVIDVLKHVESVTLVGCGTAYYAALIARYWLEDLARIPCTTEIASEFRYRKGVVADNSLFITLSQSGETADTLAALRVAKERGFKHTMTICNVASSTLVRESDFTLLMHAGQEISVASTKAFVAMLVDLLLLTLAIAQQREVSSKTIAEVAGALHRLASTIADALKLEQEIVELSKSFLDCNHALFLGRGPQYPVALEGALKLKEISYLHAEGYPAGELKHGPLALVDQDMPVIAVAPNDELLKKLESNLAEVRARGGRLVVFADPDTGLKNDEHEKVFHLPRVHQTLAAIVFVIPLQLLAYHVALAKGIDVDHPRNLAKSVTVE